MKRRTQRIICLLLVMLMLPFPAKAVNAGMEGSELAQVHITVTQEGVSGVTLTKPQGYVTATIEIVDPSGENETLLDEGATIKVRGNTTALGAKRPYNVKLSSKQDVLGMGKGKKWCLLANMYDKSLMRNRMAFDFARALGMQYIPDCRMVDVWVDGQYRGNYLLCEPVEAKENRVEIDPENGDYLLEREASRYEEGATYIVTNRYGLRFVMGEPEELTPEQKTDLMSKLDQVETAIATKNLETIRKYIDVQSFVDMYIVEEFFKNVDADYSSVRFYFKDGILYAGPVWDYDLSSGNCSNTDYYNYNNLGGSGKSSEGFYADNSIWYRYLFQCEAFKTLVKQRYVEVQPQIVNLYADNALGKNQMDCILDECAASFAANWNVWNVASKDSSAERIPDKTFAENVQYLRTWLSERNSWMLFAYGTNHAIGRTTSYYGSVQLPKNYAVAGETVRFTVTPKYDTKSNVYGGFTSVRVLDEQDSEVSAALMQRSVDANGVMTVSYAFIMPDSTARVVVGFVRTSRADADVVNGVQKSIEAIGEVNEESGDVIAAARAAYDGLTDTQKKLVLNYQILLDAERAFALLQTQYLYVYDGQIGKELARYNQEEVLALDITKLASGLDCLTKTVDGVAYTFAGWFTKPQTGFANWAEKSIKNTVLEADNSAIYAWYVNAGYLDTTIAYTSNATRATRVFCLSTVPGNIFASYGFVLSTGASANDENMLIGGSVDGMFTKQVDKTVVYTEISVEPFQAAQPKSANDFNGKLGGAYKGGTDGYLSYALIANIPVGKTVSARAYYTTLDGTIVYGSTAQQLLEVSSNVTGLE